MFLIAKNEKNSKAYFNKLAKFQDSFFSPSSFLKTTKCPGYATLLDTETYLSQKGQQLHNLFINEIERLLKFPKIQKTINFPDHHEWFQQTILSLTKSLLASNPHLIGGETPVTGNFLFYTIKGTPDLWVYYNNTLSIIDLKTGKTPHDFKFIQLKFYALQIIETFNLFKHIKKIKLKFLSPYFKLDKTLTPEEILNFKNKVILNIKNYNPQFKPSLDCADCFKLINCKTGEDFLINNFNKKPIKAENLKRFIENQKALKGANRALATVEKETIAQYQTGDPKIAKLLEDNKLEIKTTRQDKIWNPVAEKQISKFLKTNKLETPSITPTQALKQALKKNIKVPEHFILYKNRYEISTADNQRFHNKTHNRKNAEKIKSFLITTNKKEKK